MGGCGPARPHSSPPEAWRPLACARERPLGATYRWRAKSPTGTSITRPGAARPAQVVAAEEPQLCAGRRGADGAAGYRPLALATTSNCMRRFCGWRSRTARSLRATGGGVSAGMALEELQEIELIDQDVASAVVRQAARQPDGRPLRQTRGALAGLLTKVVTSTYTTPGSRRPLRNAERLRELGGGRHPPRHARRGHRADPLLRHAAAVVAAARADPELRLEAEHLRADRGDHSGRPEAASELSKRSPSAMTWLSSRGPARECTRSVDTLFWGD